MPGDEIVIPDVFIDTDAYVTVGSDVVLQFRNKEGVPWDGGISLSDEGAAKLAVGLEDAASRRRMEALRNRGRARATQNG
jgi:hypothetical protein